MTKETKRNKQEEETRREEGTEEDPQIYTVKKGLAGWEFSRREFLAAAAAAATAAAVGAGDKPEQVAAKPVQLLEDRTEPAMTDLEPGQPFAKVLRFKNTSGIAWGHGKRLYLVGGDEMQAPASVAVPNAAPGDTVTVRLDLVAPTTPGYYQINWHFPITDTLSYVSYLPLVVGGSASPAVSTSTPTSTSTSAPSSTPTSTRTPTRTPTSSRTPTRTPRPTTTPTSPFAGTPTPTPTGQGCLVETPHPYQSNVSETWILINPNPDAEGTRVHFSKVSLEAEHDYIILKDSTGQVYQRITGAYLDGLWSMPVLGRYVQVQLVTDSRTTRWGFCLDQLETTARPPTPTRVPTRTPTSTATRRPCSCVGHCSGYCSCVPVHYWYPN